MSSHLLTVVIVFMVCDISAFFCLFVFVFIFDVGFEVSDRAIMLGADWRYWGPVWCCVLWWKVHDKQFLAPILANLSTSSLPSIFVWALTFWIVMLCVEFSFLVQYVL